MTLSFPLALADLADLLPIAAIAWNEARQDAVSALGSGEWLTHELGPPLHEAEVRTPASRTPAPNSCVRGCERWKEARIST